AEEAGKKIDKAAEFWRKYLQSVADVKALEYANLPPEERLRIVKARRAQIAKERQAPSPGLSLFGAPTALAAQVRGPSLSPFLSEEDLRLGREQKDLEDTIFNRREQNAKIIRDIHAKE